MPQDLRDRIRERAELRARIEERIRARRPPPENKEGQVVDPRDWAGIPVTGSNPRQERYGNLELIHDGSDPRVGKALEQPKVKRDRVAGAKSAATQVVAGAAEMTGATLKQAGRVSRKAAAEDSELPNPALLWMGRKLEKLGEAFIDVAPAPDPGMGLLGTVARASGGSATFMGAGGLGKLGVGGMGVLANGYFESEAASQRALARGATAEEAEDAGWTAFTRPWTLAAGASEILPIAGIAGRIMGKADRASGGMIRRLVENAVKEGHEELWQETGQSIVGILNEYMDEEDVAVWTEAVAKLGWEDLGEALESGAVGALSVGPISAIGTVAQGRAKAEPTPQGRREAGSEEVTEGTAPGQDSNTLVPLAEVPITGEEPPPGSGEGLGTTLAEVPITSENAEELPDLPEESRELGEGEKAKLAKAAEKRERKAAKKLADSFGEPLPAEPQEPEPIVRPLKTPAEIEAETPEFQEFMRQREAGEAQGLTGGSVPAAARPRSQEPRQPASRQEAAREASVEAFPEDTTSIKVAKVDAELAEMGMRPSTRGEATTFEAANQAASEAFEANPMAGQELLRELERSERPVGPEEVAILTQERNRLRIQRPRLEDERIAAFEAGDDAMVQALGDRIEEAQNEFIRASDITSRVGTKTAQGLALRRMEIKQDYSLANLERTMRAAQGGAPLTETQQTELREMKSQLDDALKRLDRLEQKRPRTRSGVRASVSKRADEARARIKARRESGQTLLRSGTPTSEELADFAAIGADLIVRGVEKFADFSRAMVAELGEGIRPHLQKVFDGANRLVYGDTDEFVPAPVSEFESIRRKGGALEVKGDPDAIRSALPEGLLGRKIKGGLLFTKTVADRVEAALRGERVSYSRGGRVSRHNRNANGEYIGAPKKFNTPGKIPTLRRWLLKLALEGEPGRFWYERSSAAILRMTGGDKIEARKFVALLSIYSPQASVDTNSTFALRAWAQYKAGQPINVKTASQDAKAEAALKDIDTFWSGEKTANFYKNLLARIDGDLSQGATIDLWMMRAGQYGHDAPTATEYAFMEIEVNRVARELGWEPQQVQAAIWVAMKARMENAGVKKKTEAISEKRGWISFTESVVRGKKKRTRVIHDKVKHRDNWLRQARLYDPAADDTVRAKFDFEDGLQAHVGQISWEAAPGRSTGVLPGLHDAPWALRVAFQQDVQKALLDEDGADILAKMTGLLVDQPDVEVPGVWQGSIAPGSQRVVPMAPGKGTEGKGKSIDDAQRQSIELYSAILGLLTHQEAVGYHRPFYKGAKRDANAVEVRVGRPLTPAEATELWSAVDEEMRSAGYPNWESDAGLVSSPQGMRVINFGAVEDNPKFAGLVKAAAAKLTLEQASVGSFSTDGNLVSNDWKKSPHGEDYRSRVAAAGRSDLLGRARDLLGPRIQRVFDKYSKEYGWGDPGEHRLGEAQAEELTGWARKAADARARIKARRDGPSLLRSGTPTTEELVDYAIVGADWIARGVANFAEWSAAMTREFGQRIAPYLQEIYDRSTQEVDDVRIERARAALERSIKELTRKIEEGDLSTKRRPGDIDHPELNALRKKRDELRRTLQQLRRKATTQEQRDARSLKAFKSRQRNDARRVLEQLEAGDLTLPERRRVQLDEEAIQLQAEAKAAKRKLRQAIARAKRANRTRGEVVRDTAKELLHEMPRSIISSADNSGFRQAITVLYGHPWRTITRSPASMRAMFSQKFYDAHEARLRSVDYFDEMISAGVEFTSDSDDVTQGEEEYGSRLVEKLPVMGPIVKGSGRAFMTLLNTIRVDSYGYLRTSNFLQGETTTEQREAIASFVNNSTGRGDGVTGEALAKAGMLLWAPKLLASRVNLMMGPLAPNKFGRGMRRDPALRKLFLREYAQTLAGMATMYALMNLWLDGEDEGIEWDPRSSDFGKIRVGDTRVDPMGGLIQVSVLLTRAGGGLAGLDSVKSPKSGDVRRFSAGDLGRFGRYKLSPSASAAFNILTGEDAVGNPMDLRSAEGVGNLAASMYIPLPFREIHEAIAERGLADGTGLGMLAFFGMGLQIFGHKTDFNAAAREVKAAKEGDPLYATKGGTRYTTLLRKAQARIAELTEAGKLESANKARAAFTKKVEDAKKAKLSDG